MDIFASRWAALSLTAQAIAVMHRSDGSDTIFIFTHCLAVVSPESPKQVGSDSAVA